ncbi:F-box/kelch-repeat protein At1g80440-like [Musa acuminata AAA Group]|uniref:F-box/kelch-repeat protein At1g80440-like n=1 Tax=Musa acuminata AAA Group TaxID=214697 RepID=UPI0031D2366D
MRRQLLPGLPDDIARECLVRIPYRGFPTARSVCRLWKRELDSPYFHRIRKAAGLTRSVVAFAQAESAPATGSSAVKSVGGSTPSYRLSLFEPATGAWSLLPPVPGLPHGLPFFCRMAAAERELVVVGGWDPKTWAASDGVHVYDFATGSWRRGAPVPGPRRSFFACATASVGGRVAVVVAGGHDEEKNALRSAMAYDVASDTWAPLPDMAMERDECRGVCLDGRFYVIGGYSTEAQGRFSRTAEALDVAAGQWGAMEEDKLDEGTCPKTCVVGGDGRLYMSRGDQGGQLSVLDAAGWRAVAEVPGDARVAPDLVAWDGGLMVMGSETHGGAQTGYIMEAGTAMWKKVEVPEEYSGNIHAGCCLEI